MIWIVILLVFTYWTSESLSEAMTWLSSWHSSKPIKPRKYHLVRIPETLSIIISHLMLGYLLLGYHGVLTVVLAEIMSCILYERIYCSINYKNFWYQKTSKWLGIKHPRLWMEIVLFSICLMLIVAKGVFNV